MKDLLIVQVFYYNSSPPKLNNRSKMMMAVHDNEDFVEVVRRSNLRVVSKMNNTKVWTVELSMKKSWKWQGPEDQIDCEMEPSFQDQLKISESNGESLPKVHFISLLLCTR